MKKYTSGLLILSLALACNSMVASTVDILWYVTPSSPGGTDLATYESSIMNLVAQEENATFNVSGSVNTWNVTFWTGTTMPVGTYNVLVGGSANSFSTSNYTSLSSAVTSSSFGSRVMLTGQDADFHYINGPGSSNFNGPSGFLIDAINWAGSGTGMGGVLLGLDASEAIGFAGETSASVFDNSVNIPALYASFPINTGLTSAGLSNWSTSAHDQFTVTDSSMWTVINVGGSGEAVTIVSAQEASGGTSVPDASATAGLLGLGVMLLAGMKSRFSRQTA